MCVHTPRRLQARAFILHGLSHSTISAGALVFLRRIAAQVCAPSLPSLSRPRLPVCPCPSTPALASQSQPLKFPNGKAHAATPSPSSPRCGLCRLPYSAMQGCGHRPGDRGPFTSAQLAPAEEPQVMEHVLRTCGGRGGYSSAGACMRWENAEGTYARRVRVMCGR